MRWLSLALTVGLVAISAACRASDAAPAATGEKSVRRAPVLRVTDENANGLPDGAELSTTSDRASFRAWLTSIAEQQFYAPSAAWNTEQRDCAGLVRFALREALRRHDRVWLQRVGADYAAPAPDVAAYTLETGVLGEKLFRTRGGTWQTSDVHDGTFSEYADAATLKDFNATFISRDPRQAQSGDLMFYFQPWTQKYPYHVMLFLGTARRDGEGASDWVVYHTGGSVQDAGEVRKVRLATLAQHPNPRWRPVAGNQHFLGFYRLKILGQE